MFARALEGFLDIVYPKVCLSCKVKLSVSSIDKLICPKCWSEIKRNQPPFCYSCGRHLEKINPNKNICLVCLKTKLHFDRAFSPCVYTGVIAELIHQFKYKGKDYLNRPLSRLMAGFIKEFNVPMEIIDFIIPVPLHRARLREREFNQAEVLSKGIAKEFNKEVLSGVLLRKRATKTQTDLQPHQRFLNVRGSFCVGNSKGLKGKNLLLIDDVLTTGATCSEAAFTLKDAGAGVVFALTLAN